ncbi:Uma2 family endonuclease [Actinocorallia longicatena]
MALRSRPPRLSLIRSGRQHLLRRPVAWPPTAEKLYAALSMPRGCTMTLTGGRVRVDGGRDPRQLAARLAGELPDGVRVELYDGRIVVSGVPDLRHDQAVGAVEARLGGLAAGRDWGAQRAATVLMPRGRSYVHPDLSYVRAGAGWQGEVVLGSDLALAVEVASPPDAEDDRDAKRLFYAEAGVSSYLLFDLDAGEAVLFDIPIDGDYQQSSRVPFGVPLPLPYGNPLETMCDFS